jgi:hypothetical protein
LATAVANQRSFIGLYATVASIGDVSPDSLLNMVGVGNNSGDTELQIYTNDGAGTAPRTTLGANFTLGVTALFDLYLFCAPNTGTIEYLVVNAVTLARVGGVLSADLPTNTVFFAPQVWINNGSTASAVSVDLISMYWDSFY